MATKSTKDGYTKLKKDLQDGTAGKLYVLYGEEDYLKAHYLNELTALVVDETFREFNLQEFEGKGLTPEMLSDAIESYPAMAERKMVLVRDFDLYKLPSAFQEVLPDLLADLPDYVCLVFYYDVIPFHQDKRLKIHKLLEKYACFAECKPLDDHALSAWIRRRARALDKDIDAETCSYLIFTCGNSMNNLITEIEKAAAFSTLDSITKYHIDTVCTRVLDAVIFDLTDAIAASRYDQAIALLSDLIAQKNDEVQIFSAIMRHMQRLYITKLSSRSRAGEREVMELMGTRSSFYVRKISDGAKKLDLAWLRKTVQLCAETDAALKSAAADKQKQIELTLLTMAAGFGEKQ